MTILLLSFNTDLTFNLISINVIFVTYAVCLCFTIFSSFQDLLLSFYFVLTLFRFIFIFIRLFSLDHFYVSYNFINKTLKLTVGQKKIITKKICFKFGFMVSMSKQIKKLQ